MPNVPAPPDPTIATDAPLGSRAAPFDCAIIGGGPAGLSTAIYLGRLRRSSLVIDDHEGRSLWCQVNRNYLGFPDGIEATDLRKLGRRQAANDGTEFCNGQVESIVRQGKRFCVRVVPSLPVEADPAAGSQEQRAEDTADARAAGETQIKRHTELWASALVFATGVQDHFPEFVGRDECVGRTLFWCIICDGYEAIGKRVVVLGADEEAASTALQLRQFTAQLTLVAGEPAFALPPARLDDLKTAGITTVTGRVRNVPNAAGCVTALDLDTGQSVPLDMLFTVHEKTPRSDLARALGVRCDANGYIAADDEQKTNVPGIYAAGDVTRKHNHQISSAVHEGGMAAAAVNYYLYGALQKEQHPDAQMRDEG
jgi:thioredoxin reductase (NADPH)